LCDTLVATGAATRDGATLFAKNSDREPGEAQLVERLAPARRGGMVRCTHVEIPDIEQTHAVVLSRPAWMWGAEMGCNERGVCIGNEAVFTRAKLDARGLTGMDLLRLALERAWSAREAVDVIIRLLVAHGQGGRMGYRNKRFAYASSFLVADASESWVLETAGRFYAAQRVHGARTISNALTIGREMDIVDERAFAYAKERGLCASATDFDFARAFADGAMGALAGAAHRRACTTRALAAPATVESMKGALRDHAGLSPHQGLVMKMPCAHATFWPTRGAGQTTSSMVARLGMTGPELWLTGTSSPCVSVFKGVRFDGDFTPGPAPKESGADTESLWWRHERLHRAVLRDWEARAPAVIAQARALEDKDAGFEEHRAALEHWQAALPRARGLPGPRAWFWARESWRDGLSV
jgi:secernin